MAAPAEQLQRLRAAPGFPSACANDQCAYLNIRHGRRHQLPEVGEVDGDEEMNEDEEEKLLGVVDKTDLRNNDKDKAMDSQ